MTRTRRGVDPDAGLRRRAEERLDGREVPGLPTSETGAQRLLHELQVHQVELELQNEELRSARAEMEAGLARYTELFDFAPIGYATLGEDGAIREINHAGVRLLGKERRRLIGLTLGSLVQPGDVATFDGLLALALQGDKSESGEVGLQRKTGGSIHARLTATALNGAEPRVLVALEDVTERKRKEEELVRAQDALMEASRRKDEFMAVLSHELRNPLAPIRSSLYVLARAAPGSEQARKAEAVIQRQVMHLTRLVDDLLDVARIERGKVELHRERLELGDLVRRTMEDHRQSFEASGLRLEGRFEPGRFWVKADPARLIQVISNLLGNAEKFTPRGGCVVVDLRCEGMGVALRMRDTGAGIAPEVMDHLFEPFAQAPQTMDRARGGLGLGLAMVKGLVELHGGSVGISSDGPGRGAEVAIRLPLDSAPAPSVAKVEPAASPSRRVLVIDDNQDSADSLKDALELSGHQVEVAYDGPSGIERARAFHAEIALCDIGLPGMDGYAVARVVRADGELRGIYLVALTGYALPDDLERAWEAGFDEHVAKPPTLERLEELLREALAPPGGMETASPPPRRVPGSGSLVNGAE